MTRLSCILITLILTYAPDARSESGPLGWGTTEFTQDLESDRPDFTEGAQTVQSGHLQFEFGYTYTEDDAGGGELKEHDLPELLLRAGLTEDLEFRLGWLGYLSSDVDEEETSGVSDMSIGFKHRIYKADGLIPDFSLIGALSLPTGSSEYTADDVVPEAKFLWAYPFEPISLAGNINFSTPIGEDNDRYFEVASSLSAATDLTESIGSYVEYFGFYPSDSSSEQDEHYLNGGFTFALSTDVQLDVRSGFGLNGDADDFFCGTGFVFRL